MKIIKYLVLCTLLVASFTAAVAQETRKGELKIVTNTERQSLRFKKKLSRLFAALTPEQRARLLENRSDASTDSDLDGIPDIYESNSNVCDDDSDDDGINDRDEYEDGSDPDDSDSDDDGVSDGNEIELHGFISAISSSDVSVNGTNFVFTPATEFLDDDNNPIASSAFEVGDCAEVEGYLNQGAYVAEKLKEDDDC